MEQRTTVGIDLAKEIFAVCVLNAAGEIVERQRLRRAAFERWIVSIPAGRIVAMEACSSAHHWGRLLAARSHTVRLIAPAFVTPFRKSGKNDDHDAEAIAIAASQPTMRFVAVKSVEAQAILCWHRARQGWIEERSALINRLRGLLAEFGIVIARSADRLRRALPELVGSSSLPAPRQPLLLEAAEQLRAIDARLARCDAEVAAHARADSAAQRLRQVLGVGPLTSSALPAAVADARTFRNARQFSAWLGITPTQHSSGGKTRLGRSTRAGNPYLRTLLVQGARSTLQAALRTAPAKATHLQQWIVALHQRKGYHKTLVAIANKHARIVWVLLARGENYHPNAWQRGSRSARLAAAAGRPTAFIVAATSSDSSRLRTDRGNTPANISAGVFAVHG